MQIEIYPEKVGTCSFASTKFNILSKPDEINN